MNWFGNINIVIYVSIKSILDYFFSEKNYEKFEE
jgi:hypothetical protein